MVEFTADYILALRKKALRSRVWFKVLDPAERAILSLVPRCVDRVRSVELVVAVARMVVKVKVALRSPLERFRSQVAKPLAEKISQIARRWGNKSAKEWAEDQAFVSYLAIVKFNDISLFH